MTQDIWLVEAYFEWLRNDAFSNNTERREYDGVLRLLHDIPFYWTNVSDSNRAGDALEFRQWQFLAQQHGIGQLDQHWLNAWAQQAPSVLEVLLAIARRWTMYFEGPIQMYFHHLFHNLELDRYPGRMLPPPAQDAIRIRVDNWMARQFQPNGDGSPFPVQQHYAVQHALDVVDMRTLDIWGCMNAYSAEHFQ